MTISNDPSAPLVAVVGATGIQGGSVIRELIASDKPYRLRGLTRDPSKPAALKVKALGVEVVAVDIKVGNEDAVREAFRGADIVFSVTNFWEHMDPQRETAEGKLMADAAKAEGVGLFIFSGLLSVSRLSGGKYTKVVHFDSKADVVEYARGLLPTVDVQAGFYMTNLAGPVAGPAKQPDGTFLWEQLGPGDAQHPYIDMEHDYGLFVRYAIETPEYSRGGGTIYSYGELIRASEAAPILERVRGIKVVVTHPGDAVLQSKFAAIGLPPFIIDDFLSHAFFTDYGYYFGREKEAEAQKVLAGLARRPRTFEEFLRANPDVVAA